MIYVNSVSVTPKTINILAGRSEQASAKVLPENATCKNVKWRSEDSNIARVHEDSGTIYGVRVGETKIYATATDGSEKKDYTTVKVSLPTFIQTIDVQPSTLSLAKGGSAKLSATVSPSNATIKTIRWWSDDQSVVTVDRESGCVYAIKPGTTTVCAYPQDGGEAVGRCVVTVKQSTSNPEPESAKDTTGKGTVADPVDVYTGAHIITNNVMNLYGGQKLNLSIHYDSTKLASGVFGSGWYHNFEKRVEVVGCEARVYSSPSVYTEYTSTDGTAYACTHPNKNGYVLIVNNSPEYPYIINYNFEHTEYYNSSGLLAKIVNKQGFITTITYSDVLTTITDTVSGKKIFLEKDSSEKIVKVYDDALRQATFYYEGSLLTTITDLNGKSLCYTYNDDGQIATGTDSKGICYFTNTYDEFGRVKTQKDGICNSLTTTFNYDEFCCRVTTDRNGNSSTRTFNGDGLIESYTDENGNTTTYAYDERYNIARETDALGNSVLKTYNSFNKPTSITDKNGNTTYFIYDSQGNLTKIRYPEVDSVVPEETFVYNSSNQLVEHTDLRGIVTQYTYDAAGMPSSKKVGSKNAIQYSYQNGFLDYQIDAMGNKTEYRYNPIGQMKIQIDANNKETSYEYDHCGNLLKITDANGKTITNTYDGNHQKTVVIDANNNKIEYSYNGNMKNDVITLPDNSTIRYEFDGEDRPVKMTDQAGNITITNYDKVGRVTSKQFPDSSIVSYEYDKVGNVVKEINAKGAVTVKTYDAAGNVLSITDNNGNITRHQYNAMGKIIRTVNAASGTTVYKYSPAGDLLSETDTLGNTKTYTYDDFGNKLSVTDALGNTTTYTYDENDNLLTVCDALGNITTNTYNCLNQLVSVKDAKNNTVEYGYDALGRCTTVTDAKKHVFTTVYDGNGNVLKTIDAKGNTINESVYNNLNLPESVTDAAGKITRYTYTSLGKVYTVTDALNHISSYSYNSRGLNTQVRDANNNLSSAIYDTMGNLTSISGPLNGETTYNYDDMGRLISESTASYGTVSYKYNELNVREQITNARGQVRKYFHDAAGRITGYVGAEDSVSYTYDANGNVLTVTDGNGTITREYDSLNRISKYTDTFGKTIRYEYDAVGNLSKLVYPDDTFVEYTYDANNNLETVTDWANRVTTYSYDVNNRLIGVVKPDGSTTTTVYDNAQRVASTVERTASGAVITGFEYVYDDLGRISTESNLAENNKMCYTYDSLSRVTKRTLKDLFDNVLSEENFSYDAAGNIVGDSEVDNFIYDPNNRLIVYDSLIISYDEDGNMLSDPFNCIPSSFEYDSANRLVKASGHTYTYNAEDVRIRNLCSDEDTIYTYNTNCKLSQLLTKTTNGVTTKYVYGHGLIGEEECNEFKTYHFDYRGSTVAITDECGNITDTFKYDSYGKLLCRTGANDIIFGYNGRDGVVTDDNGLIYMRARYYSPEIHRFINADIIPGEISNAITLNRYAYANGNPVSNTDPFGLVAENRGSGSQHFISAAPTKVDSIPVDILNQILNLHNNNNLNYYYNGNYNKYATIKVDKNGNITYTFSYYNEGLLLDHFVSTQYYFEVEKASYWQSKLDYEISNIFDNKLVQGILGLSELGVPGADLPTGIEFGLSILELIDTFGRDFIGDTIEHNTDLSAYLFDKVIYKEPDEDVAILKSATTYKGDKYFWQDSLEVEKVVERVFY